MLTSRPIRGTALSRRSFGFLVSGTATAQLLAACGTMSSARTDPYPTTAGLAARTTLLPLIEKMRRVGLNTQAPTLEDDSNEFHNLNVQLLSLAEVAQGSVLLNPTSLAFHPHRDLCTEISAALIKAVKAERSPAILASPAHQIATPLSFEHLRPEYEEQLKTCLVRPEWRARALTVAKQIGTAPYRSVYTQVAMRTGVPWYLIGIIHYMECGLNFLAHLHNGDDLLKKTVDVPRNRPPVWEQDKDWVLSADDAVTLSGFRKIRDWNAARYLHCLEVYNGFGYRLKGVNTPYIWSGTNHYTSGKFVGDGQWNPNAQSNQCGGAPILLALYQLKVIA